MSGSSSVGRVSAFQADCREFESRLPLHFKKTHSMGLFLNKGVFRMSDCIFCKIINGDFGTEFVHETEKVVVFKDINPKADIHLLVVPKLHVESLNELDDKDLLGELMMTVKEVTKKLGIKAYKTLINTGKEAGQEVFHLHIHILAGRIK